MSCSQSDPDARLMARARAGDTAAFRALVERHDGRVAATVIGMLGPGPDAEDVGQEVFVRFYRALGDFRGEAALSTYLTRIAINLSLNAIKRRQRERRRTESVDAPLRVAGERPLSRPEPAASTPDPGTRADTSAAVERALAALPDEQRAVVVLRLVQGCSTRETAAALDLPEGTVTSRLTRARSTLQTLLAPYSEEFR